MMSFTTHGLRSTIGGLALVAMSCASHAATLHYSGDGQLTGASGVDVNGTLYDVSFMEGTCHSLFSYCTSYVFRDSASAHDAAYALQHQVLTGAFDDSPELVAGIEATDTGAVLTPYLNTNGVIYFSYAHMAHKGTNDVIGLSTAPVLINLATQINYTYAVWSTPMAIPVPAAAWLFGSALLGLAGIKHRRHQVTA